MNHAISINESIVIVSGNCAFTGEAYAVSVPRAEYDAWKGGELAGRALRSLSRDDREFLMSGISPRGWELTFSDDTEDERGA
jgi:hypothetical protein